MTTPALYDYQMENAVKLARALKKHGAAIDGSDTGTGKSYTGLYVCKRMVLTPFIICPKTIISKWRNLCAQFKIKPLFVGNYESFKFNKYKFAYMPRGYKPYLIAKVLGIKTNYGFSYACETFDNALRLMNISPRTIKEWENVHQANFPYNKCRQSGSFKWNLYRANILFIFDEVQKCKSQISINSKMLIAAKKFRTLLLSATPAHTPRELKASGYILGLHDLHDFTRWTKDYGCQKVSLDHDKENPDPRKTMWVVTKPIEQMKKINRLIYPEHGGRVRIADLGDKFPETQIKAELYDIDTWKEYNKLYAALVKEISRLNSLGNMSAEILVRILRFRQAAELMKVPLFTELVKEYLEHDLSVVVFVNYEKTLQSLSVDLRTSCIVHGTDTAQEEKEREQNIKNFQTDYNRVILCNIAAGGVGLDLHDTRGQYPRVALLSPTYNVFDLKQALGRVHRAGGKSKSIQRIVYAAKTVEVDVCKQVNKKLDCISALNDGDLMESDILQLKKRAA